MADYGSTSVIVRYGEVSDFSDNLLNRALAYTSTTCVENTTHTFTASTAQYTVYTDSFTTVETVAIKNKGSIAVEVEWVSLAPVNGATTNRQLLGAGAVMLLPSLTVASNLKFDTNSSSTEVEVIIYGT